MTASTASTATSTRSAGTFRRRIAGVLAGLTAAACVTVATATPAAAVGNNIASVMAGCRTGVATINLQHNMDYEYAQVWKYEYANGWVGGSQWQPLEVTAQQDLGPVMAGPSGWFAVYVQYADWNGASWDIVGEWVEMYQDNGTYSYWCR